MTANSSSAPLHLSNGRLSFAPDYTGLQTYSSPTISTWEPTSDGTKVELPQIGLWIGEPGLGPANAIGNPQNANQTINPQTGVLVSQFSAEGAFWSVTTVVNPDAPEIAFRVERTPAVSADLDSYSADTPPLPDRLVDANQPSAAAFESATGAPAFGVFLTLPGDEVGSMSVTSPPEKHGLTGSDTYLVDIRDTDHKLDYTAAVTVTGGSVQDLGLSEIAVFANGPVLDVVISFGLDAASAAGNASANTAAVAAVAAAKQAPGLASPHAPGLH